MPTIIIIGAGAAGSEAAYQLALQGFTVELVEKEHETGGNLNNWYQLFPDRKQAGTLRETLRQHLHHPNIHLHPGTEPRSIARHHEKSYTVALSDGAHLEGEALLVATGYKFFDAHRKEEYGYGIYENVITSVELENMFQNHRVVTSQGIPPRRIGIIHCVGSRDEKVCNYHCSKLCCITGVKQAVELRELLPDTEITCFYMDIRMFGPGYEEMYREAQEKYDIRFIRGRLSEAAVNQQEQVCIKVEDTLVGRPLKMTLDLMVLLVGMESSDGTRRLAEMLGLDLAPNRFIQTLDAHYSNNHTRVNGIFVAGCGSAPMSLTDTLADARSAAIHIMQYLK